MKLIQVGNKNIFAKVDDQDYDYLVQFNWRMTFNHHDSPGYVGCTVGSKSKNDRRRYMMHRLIMKPPQHLVIDHIDHDPLNNQRSNLRIVTHKQNAENKLPYGYHKTKTLSELFLKEKIRTQSV